MWFVGFNNWQNNWQILKVLATFVIRELYFQICFLDSDNWYCCYFLRDDQLTYLPTGTVVWHDYCFLSRSSHGFTTRDQDSRNVWFFDHLLEWTSLVFKRSATSICMTVIYFHDELKAAPALFLLYPILNQTDSILCHIMILFKLKHAIAIYYFGGL